MNFPKQDSPAPSEIRINELFSRPIFLINQLLVSLLFRCSLPFHRDFHSSVVCLRYTAEISAGTGGVVVVAGGGGEGADELCCLQTWKLDRHSAIPGPPFHTLIPKLQDFNKYIKIAVLQSMLFQFNKFDKIANVLFFFFYTGP